MALLYLNLISNLSFVFSLLSFAFIIIGNPKLHELTFLFLLLISSLILYLRDKNKNFFFLSFLLFLIPIFLSPSIFDKSLPLIFSLYVLQLLHNNFKDVKYGVMVDYFKRSIPIVLIITFISIFLSYIPEKFSNIERFVIPYLFIYLVISVILLRTLRYLEYNPTDKNIIIINIRYAVIVVLASVILSIPQVRGVIFTSFSKIFYLLFYLFIIIVGILFIIVGFILQKLIHYLISLLSSKGIIKVEPKEIQFLNTQWRNLFNVFSSQDKTSWNLLDTILVIVFSLLIISIILFIIFKFMRKEDSGYKKKEVYIEEKEFVPPNINLNPLQRVLSIFRRKESFEIIREYYKKYLLESKKRGIEIRLSDTTLDIYEKTKATFDSEILSLMRQIYILVRYHLSKADSHLAQEFISLYKNLHKK